MTMTPHPINRVSLCYCSFILTVCLSAIALDPTAELDQPEGGRGGGRERPHSGSLHGTDAAQPRHVRLELQGLPVVVEAGLLVVCGGWVGRVVWVWKT